MITCGKWQSLDEEGYSALKPQITPEWEEYLSVLRTAAPEFRIFYAFSDEGGLVVSKHIQGETKAHLRYFYLTEERVSLGCPLLIALERWLAADGVDTVVWEYPSTHPQRGLLERCADAAGWAPPAVVMERYDFLAAAFHPLWLDQLGPYLTPGLREVPWKDLTEEQLLPVQRGVAQGQFPQHTSPFEREELIEPNTSLALILEDKVLGWVICHQNPQDTLQFTSLYVAPPLQQRGEGLRLLAHAIFHQKEGEIPNTFFEVYPGRVPRKWLHFVRKRIAPFATSSRFISMMWKKIL